MGFARMRLGARRHRIQPSGERTQHAQQLLRAELFRIGLEQIDELPVARELRVSVAVEQLLDVRAPGELGIVLDGGPRQGRDVETLLNL